MGKPKIIAIDARFYSEAGPGRYIKNIIEHLEQIDNTNTYYIFLSPRGYKEYVTFSPNFKKVLTTARWYTWAEQTTFLFQVLKVNADLFYIPHFNIPILYPKKMITAIPDIIMHTYSTERGTTLPKPYFKFKKYIYKLVLKWALFRSEKVIVPSYDVYKDITNYYPEIKKDKFIVSYEGVDPVFAGEVSDNDFAVLDEFNLRKKDYLLYVSSMYEHKNVERLIKAYEILRDKYHFQGKLVLIGKKDKFSQRIADLVKEKHLENFVIMPGFKRYITDREVVTFRKGATLYVFPSLKEGFSLTPLEAQQVGLPCVISNISCHKEVFGDSVYYFDPLNENNMADKINSVLSNGELQENLIQRGYEQVKKYDWMDTAKDTLQAFKEVFNSKKSQ